MTSWQKKFSEKCVSAAQSLAVIQPGDRVVIGHAAGEPKVLVEELMRQSGRLADVEVRYMLPLNACEYAKPEHSRSFRHNALFVGAASREAINSGRADYTPGYFWRSRVCSAMEYTLAFIIKRDLAFFLNSKLCEKYVGSTAR